MTTPETPKPQPHPLRLWPGIALALILALFRFVLPIVLPQAIAIAMIGALVAAFGILMWWLFFSRAPWSERVIAILLMALALLATSRVIHPSIQNGMMGMMFFIFAIPVLALALVAWAFIASRLSTAARRLTLVAAILLASGPFTLLRTGGITGEGNSDLHWRWSQTPEQKLLTQTAGKIIKPATPPASSSATEQTPPEWPGFRGADPDAIIHGVRIQTDWANSPPVQLWRRPIGPAWSSFAVQGDLLYTQEQRGEDEIVSCYKLSTGEPVWQHIDAVRFWESNAGPGPRSTPTLSNGRLFTFGATGILNALDAHTGALAWSRNVAAETETKVPGWGFASSPLVIDDDVIVAASGKLAAYDVSTGQPRWSGPKHGGSYSSPHRLMIDGVTQIILLNAAGAISVALTNGATLWQYDWRGVAMVQPSITADGDLLISTTGDTGGLGMRRLSVTNESGRWTIKELWTSSGLKPYFNDSVIQKNHAYGFDGSLLACIDLLDGKRKWKGGRYGNGQLILLADQDLLLVLSEQGELVLVAANPDEFKEIARYPAIKGKTWNHPALINNILLVRNGEEMAAFKLPAW